MGVLGHLGLVAVEGWPGGREKRGGHRLGTWAGLDPSQEGLKVGGSGKLGCGPGEQPSGAVAGDSGLISKTGSSR